MSMSMLLPPPLPLYKIDPRWSDISAPFKQGDYPRALAAFRDYVDTVPPEVSNRFQNYHYSTIYNEYAVSAYHVLTDKNPEELNQAVWDEFWQALENFIRANEQGKEQQPAEAWWKDSRFATGLLDHVLDLLLRYRPSQWGMEAENWIKRFMAIWGERLALNVLLKAMHNERINVMRPDYVANTRNLAKIYLRLTETLPPDIYRHPRSLVMDILSDLAYFTGNSQAEDEALDWVERALAVNPDDHFAKQRRKDIQERKGVMEQIRRFNHDANTAIAGLISTLTNLEHLPLSDPASTLVEKIRLGLNRIHGVHRLVQKQQAGFVRVVVRQEIERLLLDYEEQIRFVISGGEDGEILETDQDYLQIVLENLIRNAREAFERRQIPVSDRLIHITLDLPGRRIVLRDNAGGIDPNLKDRIFEPYVSSKAVKQNTGLGLASVREAMTLLEGHIELTDPQPANGAEFAMYFS